MIVTDWLSRLTLMLPTRDTTLTTLLDVTITTASHLSLLPVFIFLFLFHFYITSTPFPASRSLSLSPPNLTIYVFLRPDCLFFIPYHTHKWHAWSSSHPPSRLSFSCVCVRVCVCWRHPESFSHRFILLLSNLYSNLVLLSFFLFFVGVAEFLLCVVPSVYTPSRATLNAVWCTVKYVVKIVPVQAWTGPECSSRLRMPRFQDSRHMKVVRLSALRTGRFYRPGNIPGTHFCKRLSRPQDHSAAERIMSMKNSSENIGKRTHGPPTCRAVPQPTAPRKSLDIFCCIVLEFKWRSAVYHFAN